MNCSASCRETTSQNGRMTNVPRRCSSTTRFERMESTVSTSRYRRLKVQSLDSKCGSQEDIDAAEDGLLSASSSWIIDRTPPKTEITRVTCTGCTGRRVTFTATDRRAVNKFQCRVDGSRWTSCSSPHRIQVEANWDSDNALLNRRLDRRHWKSCL